MEKYQLLKQYFGHRSFRAGQETLIDCLLSGQDVLGIMPTGGGKSICYQLPALLMDGITLVISPLISLMKDQVSALTHAGIPAAYINSSLSASQLSTVYHRMQMGAYKLIYAAPERLETESFLSALQSLKISLLAVDEAHCISQWGQDFRPSYRKIPDFLAQLPYRPAVGAFTATATEAVRNDIIQLLSLQSPHILVTGFDRPNLYFEVRHSKDKEKPAALRSILAQQQGRSGIVYCSTRSRVERVCSDLLLHGFSAARYHAGLSDEERLQSQDDFQFDRVQVMVATNAFGMGIDKSNVSFVIHYNMPKDLESYYQEAGRAGRDGARADCILLYSPGDINTAKYLIENGSARDDLTPDQQLLLRRQDHKRLDAMVNYCKTSSCLRDTILGYFGQAHSGRCDNCSSCLHKYQLQDITREAQMILSCGRRMERLTHTLPTSALLADVLHGITSPEITDAGLDQLPTYGLMQRESMARIMALEDFLTREGLLTASPEGLSTASDRADRVLFSGEQVLMPLEHPAGKSAKSNSGKKSGSLNEQDSALFTALKEVRKKLAQRESVPPYVIFSNATLTEMAQRRPCCTAELLEISGVGSLKSSRYGKAFLQAIADFEESLS